jgi:ArsR family transcriptional regulator, arsenate/arsenite/antimonite-responsive transcriptional repressor
MQITEAVAALSALAQETRLAAYRLLVEAGPEGIAAGQIADTLGVAPPALSFHLKELSHAKLVSARQEGRFIYYAADFDQMAALMTFLTHNCCRGMPQECLAVMETALSECCTPAPKRKAARTR